MPMTVNNQSETRQAVKGGAGAGIVAGAILALFLVATNLAAGQDVWLAFKGAGAPFLGERAMQPGFDALAVIVGVLAHLAVSITWGVAFGLLFYGLSKGMTMVAGFFWGFAVWIGMYYMLLPLLGLSDVARSTPLSLAIVSHLLFGIVLGAAFLPYQREYPGSSLPRAPRPTM
jgi:hypothetical protein